jgi:GIY-YIG catalytic domain
MTTGIAFNQLLVMQGIDPKDVKMYKHDMGKEADQLYELWSNKREDFINEQAKQTKNVFQRKYVASFIATPTKETLFTGLFQVVDRSQEENGKWRFQFEACEELKELEGRLFVSWNPVRSPDRLSEKEDPKVLYIKKESEKAFPGFHQFSYPVTDIKTMPQSWKQSLERLKGIYLLTCSVTGKQYVGSASGEEGFISRWNHYAEKGSGDNVGLIKHLKEYGPTFFVSLLEIASSFDNVSDIRDKETYWKNKLKTKQFGLNHN